jgi:hypothetical protein
LLLILVLVNLAVAYNDEDAAALNFPSLTMLLLASTAGRCYY